MKGWREYKLGELVYLKQGFALNKKSDHYISKDNSGLPLLKISDLINGTETLFVKESIPKQFLVTPSEIIYSRTGQVGLAFMGKTGVVYNNCFKVIPNELVYSVFLYQWLNAPTIRETIRSLATGAAQPDLNHDAFKSVKILLPPLPTQRRIASILSAYDDLIENNLKRIKLLEEIAQRTYEEWFVKFRVNGEQLPIDEKTGLPVGWVGINLNELYQIKYGKNLPQTLIKENGLYPVYGASGKMGYYEHFNADDKVVLITSRGNGSGDVHRTYERAFVTNNSFIVEPKINYSYLKISYTLNFLKTINLKGYCSGSAQPQLTNAAMDNINVLLPPKRFIETYNDLNEINITQADNLRLQNQKLKESRDILLPKLMNGTINV